MKEGKYYTEARSEVAGLVPEKTKSILDVGCGEGAFLKLVKTHINAETWGIEKSPEIAEKAKFNADKILTGGIETVYSSIPDNYFDCITFNDILEHLPEPCDVLKHIKQKLSGKGIIIASIPNVFRKEWKYIESGILDSDHIRFFTKKSMRRLFEEAGYTVTEQIGINRIKTWKFILFQLFTLGSFNDTKYLQYVCIAESAIEDSQ
jgi:2-polyprenyl-3-methyl-5-hydroxy-6-metoxy-1,4-benzoquinol methylase